MNNYCNNHSGCCSYNLLRLLIISNSTQIPNCIPNFGGKSSRHTQHYVIEMLNYIGTNFNQSITVSQVASAVGLNVNYAMGLFQSVMQLTIKQYITMMRINHAKALLSDTDKTMLDVSLTAGFNSLSRFYENFQKYTGFSPMNYRKQMRGNLPIHQET